LVAGKVELVATMPKIPRKNISWKISDIKNRGEKSAEPVIPKALREERPVEKPILDKNPVYVASPPHNNKLVWYWLAFGFMVLLGMYFLFGRQSGSILFKTGSLPPAANDENAVLQGGDNYGWQRLSSLTSELGGVFGGIKDTASGFWALAGEAAYLEQNGWSLFYGGKGEELIQRLESIQRIVAELYQGSDFWQKISRGGDRGSLQIRPGQILDLHFALGQARDFLDKLLPYLREPGEKRLVVLLENPSELRPGGGFIGSYAELVIESGSLKEIKVRDINEADREISTRTIPPKPLQAILTNWRAADANWFFDFSDSGKKTLGFLSASDIYKDVRLDGIIGMSDRVVADILRITGPLTLSSGEKISADDFINKIQEDVQGELAGGGKLPKKVLSEAAPLLLDKISNLTPEQRGRLGNELGRWLASRDLRFYWSNPDFQRFFSGLDLTGQMYLLSRDMNGSYLAIASANVGGQKSDLVLKQNIKVETQITSDGWIKDQVIITRKHGAKADDAWWYRSRNRSQLQLFTNPGTILAYADGGEDRTITPRINYAKSDYQKDELVSAVEASEEQLADYGFVRTWNYKDKKVFSTWLNLDPGQTKQIVLNLDRRAVAEPYAGARYLFVLEKQSGSRSEYFWQITAPVGFKFRENGLPVYEYQTSDLPGRWTISLTLEKI